MTALIALVRKDLLLYLNNRRALLLHLLMPVVLAAFFGSLFGGNSSAGSGKIDIGLVLQDHSEISRRIAAGLKTNSVLKVQDLGEQEAQALVKKGKLAVAVVLPEGFGEQAANALFGGRDKPAMPVYYDPSQSTVLAMVKGLLTQQVMQEVSAAVMGPEGSAIADKQLEQVRAAAATDPALAPLGEFLGSFKRFRQQNAQQQAQHGAGQGDASSAAPSHGLSMPYHTEDQALSSGPKYNGYAHSFSGMGVQFILFMGIDMGIGILLARRLGIWNRLQAAPVSLTTVLLGRALSGALIAMGLMTAIFLCAVIVFKVQISNLPGFIGIAACFGLLTAGFGLLVAAFGKTPEAARGIASFATLILVMLGGAWVPSFIFPVWMQQVTLITPTRWAVDGLDAVTWRGLDFSVAAQSMAVQLSFALLFAGLAVWKFRRDQE
jgi:ABC-2 type transport system permease protein